jgi:hypothetical protein
MFRRPSCQTSCGIRFVAPVGRGCDFCFCVVGINEIVRARILCRYHRIRNASRVSGSCQSPRDITFDTSIREFEALVGCARSTATIERAFTRTIDDLPGLRATTEHPRINGNLIFATIASLSSKYQRVHARKACSDANGSTTCFHRSTQGFALDDLECRSHPVIFLSLRLRRSAEAAVIERGARRLIAKYFRLHQASGFQTCSRCKLPSVCISIVVN